MHLSQNGLYLEHASLYCKIDWKCNLQMDAGCFFFQKLIKLSCNQLILNPASVHTGAKGMVKGLATERNRLQYGLGDGSSIGICGYMYF